MMKIKNAKSSFRRGEPINHPIPLIYQGQKICRATCICCVIMLVMVNMICYSKLRDISPAIFASSDNPSGGRNSDIMTREQNSTYTKNIISNDEYPLDHFLRSMLASRLIETFSDSLELSSLYDGMDSILYNTTSPQGQAFEWILKYDEYKHSRMKASNRDRSDNPTIVQRYILAVLFFATEGRYNYEIGSKFTPDGNKVGSWTRYGTLNFLSKRLHECSWNKKSAPFKGATVCDPITKEIKELILPEAALDGYLPEEIGFLTKLEHLDFQNNHLHGTIPTSIGKLTSLRTLCKKNTS